MAVLNFISDADPVGTIDVFIQNPSDFDAEYAAADRFALQHRAHYPVEIRRLS